MCPPRGLLILCFLISIGDLLTSCKMGGRSRENASSVYVRRMLVRGLTNRHGMVYRCRTSSDFCFNVDTQTWQAKKLTHQPHGVDLGSLHTHTREYRTHSTFNSNKYYGNKNSNHRCNYNDNIMMLTLTIIQYDISPKACGHPIR